MQLKGSAVEDAKHDLVLIVLPRDIKFASKKNDRTCVVAKACSRQEKMEALIHLTKVYLRNGGNWIRYCLPPALRNELIAFDRGGAFIPDTYVLRAPQGGVRLGVKRKHTRTNTLKRPRRKPQYVKDIRANLYDVVR
jgi:hypothetical protein